MYIITVFHGPRYLHFEYFLRDFLLAFDEEIVLCVVQFARKKSDDNSYFRVVCT